MSTMPKPTMTLLAEPTNQNTNKRLKNSPFSYTELQTFKEARQVISRKK